MLLVTPSGDLTEPVLGADEDPGEQHQVIVPGGWWQACEPVGDGTLVSTFMSPPDDAAPVSFAGGRSLAGVHPAHAERILRLARDGGFATEAREG